MAFFVIVYDRGRGKLVRQSEHADQAEALQARFRAEEEFGDVRDIEIVALSAGSEDDLRRTHARYFLDLPALADRMS